MDKTIYSREYGVVLKLIVEKRQESGLTQVELSKKLSINQSTYSKFETGQRRLDVVQLRTICRHLGIGLQEFVAELESRIASRNRRIKPSKRKR